jgi:hypothetical protein
MRYSIVIRILCAVILGWLPAAGLSAQTPAPSSDLPQTYSFMATESLIGPEMTVKGNRNGSKELIERTAVPRPGVANPFHDRVLYDFQAHRIYTTNLTSNLCTTQEYDSPNAPMFDPIGGSQEMVGDFASHPPKVVRTESVNGIAARLVEIDLPDNQGKYRIWLDAKYNFILKFAAALQGAPETTQIEVKQLSYAPSPAALFTPPAGCAQIGGATTANGGHFEVSAEVDIPTQTYEFGGAASNAAGAQPAAPPAAAGAGKVTAVRLRLVPESYSGPCPAKVQLVAEITTDGPGKVWYQFQAGAVAKNGPSEGEVGFGAAGTQSVTLDGAFRTTPMVPNTSFLASMKDKDGNHGPLNVSSGPVKYNVTCAGQAGPK